MEDHQLQGPPVETICTEHLPHGTITDTSTPLQQIARLLDRDNTNAVYLVDARDRYAGLITPNDVLAWITHQPAAMEAPNQPAWTQLAPLLGDTPAQDAANPKSDRAPVEPTEPITHALNRMLTTNLPVAPVVTPNGTIEGEITLTRALTHAADTQITPP